MNRKCWSGDFWTRSEFRYLEKVRDSAWEWDGNKQRANEFFWSSSCVGKYPKGKTTRFVWRLFLFLQIVINLWRVKTGDFPCWDSIFSNCGWPLGSFENELKYWLSLFTSTLTGEAGCLSFERLLISVHQLREPTLSTIRQFFRTSFRIRSFKSLTLAAFCLRYCLFRCFISSLTAGVMLIGFRSRTVTWRVGQEMWNLEYMIEFNWHRASLGSIDLYTQL